MIAAATCLSHLANWMVVSNRILPEAALCDRRTICCDVCQILGYELLEILPKHLLQILGPSNRHGPYMPQAEAVANERIIFVETVAETSDGDRRHRYQDSQSQNYETNPI